MNTNNENNEPNDSENSDEVHDWVETNAPDSTRTDLETIWNKAKFSNCQILDKFNENIFILSNTFQHFLHQVFGDTFEDLFTLMMQSKHLL